MKISHSEFRVIFAGQKKIVSFTPHKYSFMEICNTFRKISVYLLYWLKKKELWSGKTSVYPLFRKLREEIKKKKFKLKKEDGFSVSPKGSGLMSHAKAETQPKKMVKS